MKALLVLIFAATFSSAALSATGASSFVVSIPEPAPLTLVGIALVGLVLIHRHAMISRRHAFSGAC